MDVHKKHNFMVSLYTGARWVKPAKPAERIFLTLTLLMGALWVTLPEPASITTKQEFFPFFGLFLLIVQKVMGLLTLN